jgi:uncharacterized membrane protein YgaE (UPF0421/DUF939 family)
MADRKANLTRGRHAPRYALFRLRVRLWPIVQTATAAVAAWYLAKLLVSEEQPVFASIAAVVSLGATHGRRDERALELIGGVVLGITVADLLVRVIGTGPLQIGLLVVLAMSAAVLLGGGAVLVTEAAVSAILLASLGPASTGLFSADRLIEAMVGGGVALAVSSLVFPLDAQLYVGRAAQSVFGQLGRVLDELATALAADDRVRAAAALVAARSLDEPVRSLEEALETGRETARSSPVRRPTRVELDRYARGARHIDYAVRNSRVLARHVLRFLRTGQRAPRELPEAIRELALAVWALAAEFEDAARTTELQLHVSRAAAHALATHDPARSDLALAEIVGQVRSTAIDLLRASEAVTHAVERPGDVSTEELLIQLPHPWGGVQKAA